MDSNKPSDSSDQSEEKKTVEPEVKATEQPDVKATGQPEVKATEQPDVKAAEQPEVQASNAAYVESLNISPSAKAVRLKELNKQTAKIFSAEWFLEYFRGDRTAFYAWWTWFFIGRMAFVPIFLPLRLIQQAQEGAPSLAFIISVIVADLLFVLAQLLASVILWKCARNSTPFFKFFAKFWALVSAALAVYSVSGLFS